MCDIPEAAHSTLSQLQTPRINTGWLLIEAIQHRGILFCDNNVDIEILDYEDGCMYDR